MRLVRKLLKYFLLLLALLGIYLTAGVLWPLDRTTTPDTDAGVVLRNIKLVDLETGKSRPDTDIVLLEDNLLANIEAVLSVDAVVLAGQLYDRKPPDYCPASVGGHQCGSLAETTKK